MEARGVYVSGSSEGKLSKVEILRGLVAEKMTVAVREILAVVETTAAGYENEVSLLKRELSLKKKQLDAILQPRVYLNRIEMSSSSSDKVRHVQKKSSKYKDNGTARKHMGQNSIVDEPSTVSHEETLLDQEESDCTFVDLPSDSSVSSPTGREECLKDDKENYAQKSAKRRRQLPKRYRSSDDETDFDGEKKKKDKEWKPNQNKRQRSSNVNKKRVIILRVGLLKSPNTNQSKNAFGLKGPCQTIACQQNLSESDFFNHLRSTFPELGEDAPLEAVFLDRRKRSVLRPANKLTQTELYTAFRNAENYLAFYLMSKEHEDTCDTPTASPDHKPNTSDLEEQPPLETGGPSKSTDDQDCMSSIVSSAQNEGDEDGNEWKPEQNNSEHSVSPKFKKIREKKALKLSSNLCKVCNLSFHSKKILTKHALCHLDNPKIICGVCGQELETSEELKNHLETHQKLHQCEACGRYFLTFLVFQKHLVTCSLGKTTSDDDNTLWKKITVPQKDKPHHKCDLCPRSFRSEAQLNFHKSKHTGEKPYCCDICGKRLSDCRSLYRHKMIHTGVKNYSCQHCGKLFISSTSLKCHEKIHSDRERNFLCDICSKSFYTKTSLMMHQRIHASCIIKCLICEKLIKRYFLDQHMKSHSGERPYSCKICGVKFRLNVYLKNHMNAHLGIKPYSCTVCGYKCSRKEHLSMHMSTHTGHKPYKCTLCGKAYSQRHCLKTHMKSHQTEEQSAADALA